MKIFKTKSIIALILVTLSIIFLIAFNSYKSLAYDKVQIKKGSIQKIVSATGTITAEKKANLSFKSTGKIVYFPFTENDKVAQGEVLAVLDQKILQNNVNVANSALQGARTEIDEFVETNQGDLGEPKIIYQKKQLEEKWKQARLNLDSANQNLLNASLISPFDGIVTIANGQINEWVGIFEEMPLVQVVDFSTLYFEAEVEQEDSFDIKPGQQVIINLDALENETFEGEVYEVSKFTTKTPENNIVVLVKIKFINPPYNLKIGLEGDAQIIIKEKEDVLLLPKKVLEKDNEESHVNLWRGNKLVKTPVKVGIFDGNYWEVVEGLNENDVVAKKKD